MVNHTLLDIAMNHADSLIQKAQAGDDDSFNKLVSLWYKRIYNYCFKYAGSHDLAMDDGARVGFPQGHQHQIEKADACPGEIGL